MSSNCGTFGARSEISIIAYIVECELIYIQAKEKAQKRKRIPHFYFEEDLILVKVYVYIGKKNEQMNESRSIITISNQVADIRAF